MSKQDVRRNGGRGARRCSSLLAALLATLLLLLAVADRVPLLDALNFFDHESSCDSLSDFVVSEHSAVGSADRLSVSLETSVGSWSADLDALHLSALSLLFDVLNGELATWGPLSSEAVSFGPVAVSPLVRDSSIQHI